MGWAKTQGSIIITKRKKIEAEPQVENLLMGQTLTVSGVVEV